MGLLRGGSPCARTMARLGAVRSHYCALLLAAALAVCAFYYLGSGRETFSTLGAARGMAAGGRRRTAFAGRRAPPPPPTAPPTLSASMFSGGGDDRKERESERRSFPTRADEASEKVDGNRARRRAQGFWEPGCQVGHLGRRSPPAGELPHEAVIFHDVAVLTDKLFPVVAAMQKHFSAGSGTYYSDSIFFLSVAMHQIMPKEILRIIQLDLDLKYKTNIRELFEEFDNFLPSAIIGIAREMQPVYRHTFWQFRHENPQTRVGDPPPEGLPGFNSGVVLLHLDAMRQSPLYGRLLEPERVRQLADKYHFRGHLGDQDFFTMIGMEHPELFHVLDCAWNRQLCTWWRDHGYRDVFEAYFRCEGHVKIYHGNCNTPIPED
ncbi:xyloside xylosyltransferase 1 [Echinops telfairi]|uniref:Xyloside xylosyltransferase 1 n=1 Tax=Echinops telfairi TaxID=9371 RepID=A0AC55CVD9_ECHTE|nr:xyloside xylosyltransferase 1 [Echinops telfairi]